MNRETAVSDTTIGGHHAAFTAVRKPDQDDRGYRLITLEDNSMDCLVISDPSTDKSSAALDVHVGHLCDPDEAAGLAHFCEHLLFMGTTKYPSENDYSQYLSEHGGYSNAFTGVENTNYYFEVASDHLEGALDRFAQFFICPLFTESCTDRELKAVDSEHKKNLQSDTWRTYQLEKDLSNPNHPYCKFGTGSLETLKDIPENKGLDVRKLLLDFHSKYYSANIMKLVVLGKEPLDTLTEWVVRMFSDVPSLGIKPPAFQGHPLTENELMKQVLIKPVKEIRHLELVFPFPDLSAHYESQPSGYGSHLIGHEAEGSILSLLKQKGWANALSAGYSSGGINFGFFKITVDLTAEGQAHYNEVIVIIFQYIDMIKKAGIQKWIFNECKSLYMMHFRFKEKKSPASYASNVAQQMHQYAKEDILSGPYLLTRYEPEMMQQCLSHLRPDNFRVTLVSPDFDTTTFAKAKWYGTEYLVEPLSEKLRTDLTKLEPNPDLHLPRMNEFIPESFDVDKLENVTVLKGAQIILETPLIRFWHKKDDTFWVPKGNVWFHLRAPLSYVTPRMCVLTRLYTDMLRDSLNELSYYAEVAGLSYDLDNNTDGLVLVIGGYNDKIGKLLEKIVEKMSNLKINPTRFKSVKEQLTRQYKNWDLEAPYQHSVYYLSYVTQECLWTSAEKLAALEDVTPDDVQSFFPNLLSEVFIEGLSHGNIKRQDALRFVDTVLQAFQPKPLPVAYQMKAMRTHILPEGTLHIQVREVPNADNPNSAIEYYLQFGDYANTATRTKATLLSHIINEPCFDQLRTKEQLGYMVFSGLRNQTSMTGLRLIIQSEKHPAYLESRIEDFLTKMRTILSDLSETAYATHVQAVVSRLLEKDKNLGQESSRVWTHVSSHYYNFRQSELDAEQVKAIQKDDLLAFYDQYVHPDSPCRRKLSVHVTSKKAAKAVLEAEAESILAKNVILQPEDVAMFKGSLELSRSPAPVAPVASFFDLDG
ncbi:Metalloenzyme, LuxS/M16 peptidase-like protein [Polychytrium aggregatum]|uniref:Metalloenzyme, LuxS/M16 peptidase-like protein n=1 Tax=Polychytrium aggregatum TaxID=110093 RepID=UPI0022FE0976|nr:Metalloenzyme, LuxS/M16 peptidase-like protein [Polychytrium aggregatum]KAI9204048.1 Metalloenzyme, LuxS/M16 peptidase-like protein [Polychytrium aggregatum]